MRFFVRICLLVWRTYAFFSAAVPEGAFSHSFFFLFAFIHNIDNCCVSFFSTGFVSVRQTVLCVFFLLQTAAIESRHILCEECEYGNNFMLLHLKPKMKALLEKSKRRKKRTKHHKSYTIELLFIVHTFKMRLLAIRAHSSQSSAF